MKTTCLIFTVFLLCLPCAVASIYYVSVDSGDDSNDGLSWATSKKTIQAAVDVAGIDDTVLVTNGVYNTGVNTAGTYGADRPRQFRLIIWGPLTVQSVNGPTNTIIEGGGPLGTNAVSCVWLSDGAILSGFTLINGFTGLSDGEDIGGSGGGTYSMSEDAIITNCVLASNTARRLGGGAFGGTLKNCTLVDNSAGQSGGGAARSSLIGCILTNNRSSALSGGGAALSTLWNCTLIGNRSFDGGGASYSTLNSCTLSGNIATNGGGSFKSALFNCTLVRNTAVISGGGIALGTNINCSIIVNSARYGGGAATGTLVNCTITSNSAAYGGGINGGSLYGCTLSANTASNGGGAYIGILSNCTISGNSATNSGGGAMDSSLVGCLLLGNSADTGGGTRGGTASNCTIVANMGTWGGAVFEGTVINSIVISNESPSGEHLFSSFRFTCGPQMPVGNGNITSPPMFVSESTDNYRLLSSSPCINAGTNNIWMLGQTDLDGHLRILDGHVDMGAYEFMHNPQTDTDGDGMPDWWEDLYGFNSSVSNVSGADADMDDVLDLEEFLAGTNPTNHNTDGDQYDDGVELHSGMDPTLDDSHFYGSILSNSALFGLYTSNSIGDLSFGSVMLNVSNGILKVKFLMEQSNYLTDGWTNIGPPLIWETPATSDVKFYRFIGE